MDFLYFFLTAIGFAIGLICTLVIISIFMYRQIVLNENILSLRLSLPGSSKKLDVRLCRPRIVFWKFSGPISSTESQFDTVDSRDPRLLAKYARPPFIDPLLIGEHGLLMLVDRV